MDLESRIGPVSYNQKDPDSNRSRDNCTRVFRTATRKLWDMESFNSRSTRISQVSTWMWTITDLVPATGWA